MAEKQEQIGIIAADLVAGGLLIHFTNETSTLFHSQFLFDVRNEDHNVAIVEEGEEVSG
jgi:hypothetical protein